LDLAPVRQSGFDAIRKTPEGEQRLQIKGRCVHDDTIKGRMGRIDKGNADWDGVLLVLLDDRLEATVIYEAARSAVVDALEKPGSRSRNERGALGVRQFMSIAQKVWERGAGKQVLPAEASGVIV
jgi:hypothetical protein